MRDWLEASGFCKHWILAEWDPEVSVLLVAFASASALRRPLNLLKTFCLGLQDL